MPQTGSPILRVWSQIQRHFAKGFIARADSQEILGQPRVAMTIEQSPDKLCAMAADEQMATGGIFHQRADIGFIQYNVGWLISANGFVGQGAGVVFIADANIAAKAHALGSPGKQKDRQNRAAEFCKFD